jgi:hypothetical protein
MEPTDLLDAPNRRLPGSRVRRFKRKIRLSDIFDFPRIGIVKRLAASERGIAMRTIVLAWDVSLRRR